MKVIVVGAGVAGLTLADALARAGHRVVVLEGARELKGDQHMLEPSGAGHVAAERLGLLPVLEGAGLTTRKLVFHRADGAQMVSIPHAAVRTGAFRGRHLMLTRGALVAALYARARSECDIVFGARIEAMSTETEIVRIHLADGTKPAADLLVGADGMRSDIRTMMFGLPEQHFRTFLGYRAAAFVMKDPTLTRALGEEVHVLAVSGRQVITYPVWPDRIGCLLVHQSKDPHVDRARCSIQDELKREYGRLPWVTSLLLEHASAAGEIYFDAVSQVDVPHWSTGRTVLIGDAAHGASLLAGQGGSLAIAGAQVLAAEIARDPQRALARYEARMRALSRKVQQAGRDAGDWLVPSTPLGILRHRVAAHFARWGGIASRVVRGAQGARAGVDLDGEG